METAQPLLPAFSTMIKNISPKTLRIALMIKKYSGELLSPRALNVLEKKLYKNSAEKYEEIDNAINKE